MTRRGDSKYDNIAGIDLGGRTLYFAACGHEVGRPDVQRCMTCVRAASHPTRRGYTQVCINGKNRPLHRVVAEEALGRPLKDGEVVHHMDMDKTNNANDNLLICTRAYHQYLHHKMQEVWVEKYKQERDALKVEEAQKCQV